MKLLDGNIGRETAIDRVLESPRQGKNLEGENDQLHQNQRKQNKDLQIFSLWYGLEEDQVNLEEVW